MITISIKFWNINNFPSSLSLLITFLFISPDNPSSALTYLQDFETGFHAFMLQEIGVQHGKHFGILIKDRFKTISPLDKDIWQQSKVK